MKRKRKRLRKMKIKMKRKRKRRKVIRVCAEELQSTGGRGITAIRGWRVKG
jgi:hypothetical protein